MRSCGRPGSIGCGYGLCLSRSRTVFASISPRARAWESARGSATRERSFAVASRCNFNRGQGFFCLQSRRSARCRGGPWAFDDLRDDELVPVICPTCQMFSKDRSSRPARRGYFAWGCFRYFSWERVPRRPCRWLSHSQARPPAFVFASRACRADARLAAANALVPLAGIEPALLAELDFESSASTNSATGAFRNIGRKRRGREAGGI